LDEGKKKREKKFKPLQSGNQKARARPAPKKPEGEGHERPIRKRSAGSERRGRDQGGRSWSSQTLRRQPVGDKKAAIGFSGITTARGWHLEEGEEVCRV